MKKILVYYLFVFAVALSYAQQNPIYTTRSVAIKGYDPVAYFTEQKALEGSKTISLEWNGATWLFSNEANRDLFKKNPEKYAPQFGGYCAYAISQNYTYRSDPEVWKIVDGKLYLNYDKNTQKEWESKQTAYIRQAGENWPKVLEKQ